MFRTKTKKKSKPNTNSTQTRIPSTGLPYIRGLSETLTPIFQQQGIRRSTRPFNALRLLFAHPKDKSNYHQKCGVIYKISFLDCGERDILEETGRTFVCRMREHTRQREPTTAVGNT